MMKSKHLSALRTGIRILVLTGVSVFLLMNCHSPTSPGGEGEADIIIYNEYGESMDIYLDGGFKFTIQHNSHIEMDDVSHGEYEFVAKKANENEIIDSETILVEEDIDYTWVIDDPPDIRVYNYSGETLEIYMDGDYQFDMVDEEDRWIIDVPYGKRFLLARRKSDGNQIASITINADKNADYVWTIE